MRFLIVNSDYPAFLRWFYRSNQSRDVPYGEQLRRRYESLFGVSDFYSRNLQKLGHEAKDVFINNPYLQGAWAREHGLRLPQSPSKLTPGVTGRCITKLRSRRKTEAWIPSVLAAQIEEYRPDVLLNQDMGTIDGLFFKALESNYSMLIGQHAATQVPLMHLEVYDVVISSFPPTLKMIREAGAAAELHRLGFEPEILDRIELGPDGYDISFVGSLMDVHSSRRVLLEQLAIEFPALRIWSADHHRIPRRSPLRGHLVGEAWGRSMYEILGRSRITINHHGDVPAHANNLRLYEATGVGTLLLTDWKPDLEELFRVEEEVVAYRDVSEAISLIREFLRDEPKRRHVAGQGQSRTINEHTWQSRMQELLTIVSRYS